MIKILTTQKTKWPEVEIEVDHVIEDTKAVKNLEDREGHDRVADREVDLELQKDILHIQADIKAADIIVDVIVDDRVQIQIVVQVQIQIEMMKSEQYH